MININDRKTAFIFGLGFSGKVLARVLKKSGFDEVRGTNRKGDAVDGVDRVFAFPAGKPISDSGAFDGVSHVISTIPVIDGTDPVLAVHGEDLRALRDATGLKAGYVSATSVYTESGGGWVNEASPTQPRSRRGQLRLVAEAAWRDTLGADIFRAAGIYGAGRSPFRALLDGEARIVSKPGHAFNRIHVEDMARVITAAMLHPREGEIYNLADGNPCEAGDVIRHAAGLLGVAPPRPVAFADAELSDMARSFYATSRKVDNAKIKTELGIDLLYPDYRAGLKSVLAAERKAGII